MYAFFLMLVEWTEEFIGNYLCLYYRAPSLSLRSFLFIECDAINMQVCLVVGTAFSFYKLRRQRKAVATRWQTSVSLDTGHKEAQGGTGLGHKSLTEASSKGKCCSCSLSPRAMAWRGLGDLKLL